MRRLRAERGTAAVELAIVAPALMLLVLGVLQFGLWYHAESVARTAAVEAARAAAAEDGAGSAGQSRGLAVLDSGLGQAVSGRSVSVSVGPEVATAVVSARMPGLLPIPGLSSFGLHAQASAYRERFRPAE